MKTTIREDHASAHAFHARFPKEINVSVRSSAVLLGLLAVIAGACAPAAPGSTGSAGQTSSGEVRTRPSQTLATVVRLEPVSLAVKAVTSTGTGVQFVTRVFNADLDLVDGDDRVRPYLAEALPELNTDTWRVFQDGRMETSYRLKPNLNWHDGTAMTAEDFVFALQVYKTPELGVAASSPINVMDDVLAPDPRTVVIQWKTLFPGAGVLSASGGSAGKFQALPRHVLEAPLRQNAPDTFASHPFWSHQYVGLGPFKLEHWEPGSYVEGSAFDGHVLGRPKIDKIQVRFIPDENTALANLLSENVHMATDRAVRFEHTQVMRREWESNRRGQVLPTISLVRYVKMQNRPEFVSPPAMLDLRVRRAIASSVDKTALSDGVFDGQATLADTFVSPDVPNYADIDRALMKYPFDPRRSADLMSEAGLTKDRDGFFASPSGERFNPVFWEESGSQNEKELNVFVDTWRRAGFDMQTFVIPAVQLRDTQLRSSYPAMYTTQGGASTEERLDVFASFNIPTANNRFTGNNYGGWINPEYDAEWTKFTTTLGRAERNQHLVQMLRIVSEEVPAIPIYFNMAPTAYLSTLNGPTMGARVPDARIYWDIHEWDWR